MRKSVVLLDAQDIDRVLSRMSHEILEIHRGGSRLALIGIHTRGVFLARRIRSKILDLEGIDLAVGTVDINLYRDDWTRISHNPVLQSTDIPFSIDGMEIVLVDDVLFTGRTIRAAMDAIMDYGRPDRLELAVLVDRGHRELPIQANYVGRFMETKHDETINVLLVEHDGEDKVLVDTP